MSTAKTLESVLLLSVRNFRHQAANGSLYEFEDLITGLCDSILCSPENEKSGSRKRYRSARYLGFGHSLADSLASMGHLNELEVDHDLIMLVLDNPWQMHLLNQVRGWREHPAKKICYISECWPGQLSQWRLMKEPFSNFDHIFLGTASSVPVLANLIDIPCSYLPCGVNTSTFSDMRKVAGRLIDVSYIGRREQALHGELKRFTETEGLFYLFDSARAQRLEVDDPVEHRRMYASMLKRTQISMALPAKSNAVDVTGGFEEIATRFFEFMAAGVIVVGRPPDSDAFRQLFDWQDAVISVGHNYSSSPSVIRELLNDHEKARDISKRNIINSLKKNDWVYRFIDVVEAIGFQPNRRMRARVEELAQQIHLLEADLIGSSGSQNGTPTSKSMAR